MLKVYSYTALDNYRNCPQKYKFIYLDKAEKDQRVNAATYLGNAVHRTLEILYNHGADNILYPKEKIVEDYHAEWSKLDKKKIKVGSDMYTVDDYIRIGEELLLKYYDKYQPFNMGTLLGAELNHTFTLPGSDIKFRCKIDRLIKRDDGSLEICDYKTGQYMLLADSPQFFYQMGIYLLAVLNNYPDHKDIELCQHYLRKEEFVVRKFREDEVDLLIEELKNDVNEIVYATRLNSFPVKEGNHCGFCDYFDICPAKIHKKNLEETDENSDLYLDAQQLKQLADEYIDTHLASREIKQKLEELKARLLDLSRTGEIKSFEGDKGRISLRMTTDEKFITKTENPKMFAELQAVCRELGLDNYFKLDNSALMKDGIIKSRLPQEMIEKLREFTLVKESNRVTVKLNSDYENKD